MKLKYTMLTLLASAMAANAATTILIDASTRNGSFELLGGAASTLKATHWDTDPDGDVDGWTQWAGASGDSGAENNTGTATDGSRVAFLQATNQTYNLTGHTIQVGDLIEYSWDHAARADRNHQGGLVVNDGGTVSFFSQTGATITIGDQTVVQTYSGSYTVMASDTDLIGNELGFGFLAIDGYPELDNVMLQVTPIPEPSSTALLGLGAVAFLIRRRK